MNRQDIDNELERMSAGFMAPDIQSGDWYIVEGPDGGTTVYPADMMSADNALEDSFGFVGWRMVDESDSAAGYIRADDESEIDFQVVTGYAGRLSAPGYLDCTDWTMPADTLDQAKRDMVELYGED